MFSAEAGIGVPASADTWGAGQMESARKLYMIKCTKCHKLRDPADYDDDTWAAWMEKMRKKAHLNDEQFKSISRYVESLRRD
jgi:hypothetical protein